MKYGPGIIHEQNAAYLSFLPELSELATLATNATAYMLILSGAKTFAREEDTERLKGLLSGLCKGYREKRRPREKETLPEALPIASTLDSPSTTEEEPDSPGIALKKAVPNKKKRAVKKHQKSRSVIRKEQDDDAQEEDEVSSETITTEEAIDESEPVEEIQSVQHGPIAELLEISNAQLDCLRGLPEGSFASGIEHFEFFKNVFGAMQTQQNPSLRQLEINALFAMLKHFYHGQKLAFENEKAGNFDEQIAGYLGALEKMIGQFEQLDILPVFMDFHQILTISPEGKAQI